MEKAIHSRILAWYAEEKRDLPWRRSSDPYRIWISEIMLQQTRVETVVPYYERFLSHFPSVKSLASGDLDQLLNLWAGLGYYSRAKNLQKAALQIMQEFSGEFPRKREELLRLKGVGPYTAAAIASIAFGAPHVALDGNLERVFSRLLGSRANPKKEGRALLEEWGQKLVSLGSAGEVNQAFMDLASSKCLPKDARCAECPLADLCEAKKLGLQREIPWKEKKAGPEELRAQGLALIAGNQLLLARRPEGKWLSGLWDIPWWLEEKESALMIPKDFCKFSSSSQKRTITKYKIVFKVNGYMSFKKMPALKIGELLKTEIRWIPLEDLHGHNLPRPTERALEEILLEFEKNKT